MKTTAAIALAGLAALTCAGSVLAHHSGYMYQTTPIWISGTVTRFEPRSPHTIITLEDKSNGGQIRMWAVEGPPQTAVERSSRSGENVPKVGDAIEVCAFPYRPAEEIARDGRIWGGDVPARRGPPIADARQFVAGYVLATPDGEMRLWEPHGFISECIRSSTGQRQLWLDFLNANPRAHELWCSERTRYAAIQSNASFHELVEELNALLADPCSG